jgi:hypothetical protein
VGFGGVLERGKGGEDEGWGRGALVINYMYTEKDEEKDEDRRASPRVCVCVCVRGGVALVVWGFVRLSCDGGVSVGQ